MITFFQMHLVDSGVNPSEAEGTVLCKSPESFNPVHMHSASKKFTLAMLDPEMFATPSINQALVPPLSIRIDRTVKSDFPTNNRLQREFSAVREEL
jgi:hypothetical protein